MVDICLIRRDSKVSNIRKKKLYETLNGAELKEVGNLNPSVYWLKPILGKGFHSPAQNLCTTNKNMNTSWSELSATWTNLCTGQIRVSFKLDKIINFFGFTCIVVDLHTAQVGCTQCVI